MFGVFGLFFVAFFAFIVIQGMKVQRRASNVFRLVDQQIETALTQASQPTRHECGYCGAQANAEAKCPNCGAPIRQGN